MTAETKSGDTHIGGMGPVRGYGADANISGSFFDPYYFYLRLADLPKTVRLAINKPGYGPWDLFGDFMGYKSIKDLAASRDGPIERGTGPYRDPMAGHFIYDRVWYPDRNMELEMRHRYVTPFLHNASTDIMSHVTTSAFSPCSPLERKALECVEYMGVKKGMEICSDYYDDFIECKKRPLQSMRCEAMALEQKKRWIEYKKGLREYDTVYKPLPPAHAYEPGFRHPKWQW